MNVKSSLNRLLALFVSIVLVYCVIDTSTFANAYTINDDTIIACDSDGNISYIDLPKNIDYTIYEISENSFDINSNVTNEMLASSSNLTKVSDTTDSPYRNVCYIYAQFSNGNIKSSSGVLVGFNLVLVAAHGIYDQDLSEFAQSITVYPGAYLDSNGKLQTPLGSANKTGIRVPTGWIYYSQDSYDWALVGLDTKFTTYQIYGYANDYTAVTGREITTMGYSTVKNNMYYSSGTITGTTNNSSYDENAQGLWTTSTTTESGMSGGPLIDKSSGAVIGIVKGTRNILGTQISVPLNETVINTITEYKKSLE